MVERGARRPWYRSWRFWLGGAVSLVLIVWAAWALDWRQVARALRSADVGWTALAVVTVLLTIAARVLRWRGLLLPQRFGLLKLLKALLIGQVVNYLVFSQLGIVARAAALGEGHRARALGTVALEKLWDVLMLLGLIVALSLALTLPEWLVLPARLLGIGAAVLLFFLLAAVLFRRWRVAGFLSILERMPLSRWLASLLDGLEGLIRPRSAAWGLGGSLIVWGLGAATNYCVLRAFDLPLEDGPVAALMLLAALQAGVTVPSLPGSVGVFEAICVAVLALFGVGQEQALAVGLALHAVVFVPPLLMGGILMWRHPNPPHARKGGDGQGQPQGLPLLIRPPLQPPTYDSQPATPNLQPTTSNLQPLTSFPPVSVVIPAYNAADTLPACLWALRSQTYPDDRYEVIVVDDGSTDETAMIARRFGVHVISQVNRGQATARNRGAERARGDLLLFTDADCAPTRDWIARMVCAFADPDVVGAKGVYRTRQSSLVARFVQLEYEDKCDRMRGLETIDFVDTYSAAYQREVFCSAGGFDPTFRIDEDQELSFRLAEAGHRLVFAPEAQVFHTHVNQVGAYARRKFWIGYWKVRVVREHPDKLVRDSHTPQALKLQMALAALGALLLAGGMWKGWLALAGLAAWGGLILSGLPFYAKVRRRDRPVLKIAPLMLFVRAWALGLGFLLGVARLAIRRE